MNKFNKLKFEILQIVRSTTLSINEKEHEISALLENSIIQLGRYDKTTKAIMELNNYEAIRIRQNQSLYLQFAEALGDCGAIQIDETGEDRNGVLTRQARLWALK